MAYLIGAQVGPDAEVKLAAVRRDREQQAVATGPRDRGRITEQDERQVDLPLGGVSQVPPR